MKTKKVMGAFSHLITTLIAVVMVITPASAASTDAELQIRLERLSAELEKKRVELHIPGMAIAIVKDDKVIFTRGFGVSDVEKNTPVTPQTLFGIGSTTKAFTATLIGMSVDRGEMLWDDPVTNYLSYLQFPLKNKTDQVTLRDMLSHRSGFFRNDLLWASGKASREEVLRSALKAEAWSGFRKKFNYNNVMYLGAGIASAKATDMDWDTLLEERILKPLGMKDTTTHHEAALQNPNLSHGYMWRESEEKFQSLPLRNVANIAPAGAITSNVLDMAQWVRFNLANGVYDGRRLMAEEPLLEMRKPQIKVGNGVEYGLGWFLRKWQDQKVVEHGGLLNGFASEVALLPESGLGFVLLTNVIDTTLPQMSVNMVWEHLLGETVADTQEQAQKGSGFYAEYIGDYIANFAAFDDAIIPFLMKDGKPVIDVPGQRVYDLHDPNDEGRWVFTLTDTISISFDRNDQGKITAMRMHQGGMDFELPRKGVPVQAEIDPAELQKYLGEYQSTMFKGEITAIVQNTRLALDVPGEMTFELHLPDADGRRKFRVRSVMSAIFETDNTGNITGVSVYSGEKKLDTAPRITTASSALPSVEDILKLRKTEQRKAALLRAGGVRITGKITMAQAGIVGTITSSFDGMDRYRMGLHLGKMGQINVAVNENGGATDGLQPYTEFKGKYLEQIRKDHPAVDIDWRYYYKTIEMVRAGEIDGKKVYMLKLKGGKTSTVTLLVDAKNGDVLRRQTRVFSPGIGSFKVQVEYSDYREVHGLRIPFKIVSINKMNGKIIIEYETVETNVHFEPEYFVIKKPK